MPTSDVRSPQWRQVDNDTFMWVEGPVIWSAVFPSEGGFMAISAIHTAGPFPNSNEAMLTAETYWARQDVGPLAKASV